jgi:hypothetical protein
MYPTHPHTLTHLPTVRHPLWSVVYSTPLPARTPSFLFFSTRQAQACFLSAAPNIYIFPRSYKYPLYSCKLLRSSSCHYYTNPPQDPLCRNVPQPNARRVDLKLAPLHSAAAANGGATLTHTGPVCFSFWSFLPQKAVANCQTFSF